MKNEMRMDIKINIVIVYSNRKLYTNTYII